MTLNQSKITSDDIKAKQSVAEKTEVEIDNVRKGYTSVRFSVLRCLRAVDATRVHEEVRPSTRLRENGDGRGRRDAVAGAERAREGEASVGAQVAYSADKSCSSASRVWRTSSPSTTPTPRLVHQPLRGLHQKQRPLAMYLRDSTTCTTTSSTRCTRTSVSRCSRRTSCCSPSCHIRILQGKNELDENEWLFFLTGGALGVLRCCGAFHVTRGHRRGRGPFFSSLSCFGVSGRRGGSRDKRSRRWRRHGTAPPRRRRRDATSTATAMLRARVSLDNRHANPAEEWLATKLWNEICLLDDLTAFKGLREHVDRTPHQWRTLYDSTDPQDEPLPGRWDKLTGLKRLCLLRCIRPDKVVLGVQKFVISQMGEKSDPAASPFDLQGVLRRVFMCATLVFVLAPGSSDGECVGGGRSYGREVGRSH